MRRLFLPFLRAVCACALLTALASTPARAQGTQEADNVVVDKQPVPVTQAQVAWPDIAKRDSVEGRVFLKVLVRPDGRVADVQRLRVTSEQHGQALPEENPYADAFAGAAEVSARQWTFTPAQKDGAAVAVWVTLPFRFKLSRN